MYDPAVVVATATLAAVVVGAVSYYRPWSRQHARFAVAAVATLCAWVLWRVVLQLSNGENFDVDNPVLLGLSAEDVGSGVLAFLLTALALGLYFARTEPARAVVLAAAIAGLVATIVDRFV